MNKKFAIFKKVNKFYWSTNKIIYLTIALFLGLTFFKQSILGVEKNGFDTVCVYAAFITFLIGGICKFWGFTRYKPLRGFLDGYLSFDIDAINVDDLTFPLEDIKKIKISNDDYSGKLQTSKGNLGPALSNGTGNAIILFLESGQTKRIEFELINSNDFQNIRSTLVYYHLKGKLDFWELANILGEKSSFEVRDLKTEIQNFSTSANTR